jgi:hypothetical protein
MNQNGKTIKKKKKKQTARRKPRVRNQRSQALTRFNDRVPRIHFSECAVDYLRALTDPFGDFIQPPCIPDVISIPSYKFSTITRGIASIGVNNIGWCSYDPFAACWNDNAFPDAPLKFTSPAFTGATINAVADGTIINTSDSNSLFKYADLTKPGVQIRLVGGAIRVAYVGTNLDMGGMVTAFRIPSNLELTFPYSDLLQQQQTQLFASRRSFVSVNYLPDNTAYLSYLNTSSYSAAGSTHHMIGFAFNGKPSNSYSVECMSHYEVIGSTFPQTPSHSDAVGFGAATAAAQTTRPPVSDSPSQFSAAVQRMTGMFMDGATYIGGKGAFAAGAAVSQAAINRAVGTVQSRLL